MSDMFLERSIAQVRAVHEGAIRAPLVEAFFDEPTFTASYVVHDPATKAAAIIDSVLDFDHAAGRTGFASADASSHISSSTGSRSTGCSKPMSMPTIFRPRPICRTGSAASLRSDREITAVQQVFGKIFNEGSDFALDGSQFDRLLDDGDVLMIGEIPLIALHVPGHTPADMAFVIGDSLFTGDTMFMPDYGSARADFPGGDARQLYRSVQRLIQLPDRYPGVPVPRL